MVLREGSTQSARGKLPNPMFGKIAGTFYVLKYVTSKTTLNRIQIEVASYDQASIIRALHIKYK